MFLLMGTLNIFMGRLNNVLGPRILLNTPTALYPFGYMPMQHMSTTLELYLFYGLLAELGIGAHDVVTLSTVKLVCPLPRSDVGHCQSLRWNWANDLTLGRGIPC